MCYNQSMKILSGQTPRQQSIPPDIDMELTLKVVRGIADVAAGRTVPVETVRSRVVSRYEDARTRA